MALEPGKKIEYTWMSPFTHGLESVVTVELERKGDDTALQLRHAKLPDDELGRLHDGGWGDCVNTLVEQLQSAGSGERYGDRTSIAAMTRIMAPGS